MYKKDKQIWINKARSFKEAEEFDMDYYLRMPITQKLEIIQILREFYHKLGYNKNNEGRKRLRRAVRIIPQE